MPEPRRPSRSRLLVFTLGTALVGGGLAALIFFESTYRTAMYWLNRELEEARAVRFQDPDALHLLFVGDSFTAGETSSRKVGYWGYVGAELQRLGLGQPVEALSIAVPGSTSRYHYRQVSAWLEESGQVPDYLVVITGACNWDSVELQGEFVGSAEGRRTTKAWLRPIYAGPGGLMYGAHYLGGRFGFVQPGDPQQVMFQGIRDYWYEHRAYEEWLLDATEEAFAETARLVLDHGGRIVAGSYAAHTMSDVVKAEAERLEVPFRDIDSEETIALTRREGYLAHDEWHFTDRGNEWLGAGWAQWFLPIHRSYESGERKPPSIPPQEAAPAWTRNRAAPGR